ncbi:MAG TPA: ATP-binding protein [Aggregatilineales bacterium]|nr:ATP-binding protein [Aggregatilineales bacterium]
MSEPSKQQFQIHLPGLLRVLAENLYSTRKVAVRELLQNAHDSCVRRSVEGNVPSFRPRVDIVIDPARRVVAFHDNGSGLTADDVTNYLSTIGRSYTRELGERLSVLSPDEAAQLIGQFGLGFLSAFLVASEVTLITKSMTPGSEALRWHSAGDVQYEVSPAERDEVGTTVELHIKPSASFLLNPDVMLETIRQYADFLPIPIHLNGDPLPVNLMTPPWEGRDVAAATQDYIERAFRQPDPLAVIPLEDQEIDLGHDTMRIPLKGFLFIPGSSIASLREYGDTTVFIRRMFICQNQRDMLPPWARFVRGAIDCPYLQPTASREDIHQDDTFTSVQMAIEQQLVKGLRRIATEDPLTWKKIVRGHAEVIMGWAVRDNEFFSHVADIVTFRTSRGSLSLPEYLGLTSGSLYYVSRELGSLQEQVLGEGRGVPVIDASWAIVTPFLQKYAQSHPEVHLVQMDGESKQLLRPVSEEPFVDILAYYRKLGIKANIVTFKPEAIPALMIYPKDAEFIIETRNALDAGELPGPLAGLIGDYVNRLSDTIDDLSGALYLNAGCALIDRLAHTPPAESVRDSALDLIYQVARLFAGRTLTPADAAGAFGATIRALDTLIGR